MTVHYLPTPKPPRARGPKWALARLVAHTLAIVLTVVLFIVGCVLLIAGEVVVFEDHAIPVASVVGLVCMAASAMLAVIA